VIPAVRPGQRDEGAVLTLVLVLMVISALIVIPLLSYTVTVLRANQVVSDKSRDREAAEGGLRIALLDTTDLFTQCIGQSRSVAMPGGGSNVVSGATIAVSCTLVDEINPTTDMGYGNPASAAVQLGATVPAQFLGTVVQAPAVPPYPEDAAWWDHTPTATTGEIWLPELPTDPGNLRTSTPFDMPAKFGCKVFLPGRYTSPVAISSGNVYFASGVYYFEQPVTVSGDANVVVGYGAAELPKGCADDVQVGANLLGSPGVYGIDGAGATWVFGADARLVVDNSSTTSSISLKFNQRYVETGHEAERGQRISIISVNGDDDESSTDQHLVPRVVSVPRSTVAVDGVSTALGDAGADYAPSDVTLTSEAIAPKAPANLSATAYQVDGQPAATAGALFVQWDVVRGQDAGGALVDGYAVEVRRDGGSFTSVCTDPASIVPTGERRLGCIVSGLDRSGGYSVRVAAHNDADLASPAASVTGIVLDGSVASMTAPDAPTIDAVTAYAGAAAITWTAGSDNGAPIAGYRVSAQRVFLVAQDDDDDDDPPVVAVEQYEELGSCETATDLWQAAPTSCVIENLPAIPGVDGSGNANLGYRFVVTATNAVGVSPESVHVPAPAVFAFDGDPVPPPVEPEEPVVEPRVPTYPIVDLQLGHDVPTSVYVPGYIAVPMGRVSVDNPNQHDVQLIGGLLASTFVIDDVTAAGAVNSAGLGYQSDIVLQRKIRLVSSAGNTSASAVVQINDDGNFAINSWVVQ
jgi:hypothetical protein